MSRTVEILAPPDLPSEESILSGWLKQPGERVRKYEPVAEVITDKATVEVSAPEDGILKIILKNAKESIYPGVPIGVLEVSGEVEETPSRSQKKAASSQVPSGGASAGGKANPAVKRLAEREGVDLSEISGTGEGGRVTRDDLLGFLAKRHKEAKALEQKRADAGQSRASAKIIPHDHLRKVIAKNMSESVQTAPHVTSVFQCDMSAVAAHREKQAPKFQERGVKLTYTAYFVKAAAAALKAVPQVNSRWHEDGLEIFEDFNIGIGTALGEQGLVVPVIMQAQNLDLFETAMNLEKLTDKARTGKLTPQEMSGGTFTISNHGVSGSLFAAPIIIQQPQSAILGIGKLEKRPVAGEGDKIVLKPMVYVTLTIDHRALDAHHANSFLSTFVATLQSGDFR